MSEGKGSDSMFKTVEEHEKAINENILLRMEVTVMKDGKETRELLKSFTDHALKQMEYDAQTEREIAIKKLDN